MGGLGQRQGQPAGTARRDRVRHDLQPWPRGGQERQGQHDDSLAPAEGGGVEQALEHVQRQSTLRMAAAGSVSSWPPLHMSVRGITAIIPGADPPRNDMA
jgi:hypothetical protein